MEVLLLTYTHSFENVTDDSTVTIIPMLCFISPHELADWRKKLVQNKKMKKPNPGAPNIAVVRLEPAPADDADYAWRIVLKSHNGKTFETITWEEFKTYVDLMTGLNISITQAVEERQRMQEIEE